MTDGDSGSKKFNIINQEKIKETINAWLKIIEKEYLRLKVEFQQSSAKDFSINFLTRKPTLFVAPVLVTLLITIVTLSQDEDKDQFVAEDKPLSIPSNEIKSASIPIETLAEDDISFTELEDLDPPLIEELDSASAFENEEIQTDEDVSLIEMEDFTPTPATSTIEKRERVNVSSKLEFENDKEKKRVKSWVFNKKPEQYTVQLIGGANKEDILKFLDDNKSLKRLSYFETIQNGKLWYVVVQSTYDKYEDANRARNRLPNHIAKNKPWIRTYGAIQKDLLANSDKLNLLSRSFASSD